MSNHDFHEKLTKLVEVYEHLGGELGTSRICIDAPLVDPETYTAIEREGSHVHAQDKYLGVLVITKSNPKQYASLLMDIENQFT